MHSVGTAERHNALAMPAVEDEDVAARSAAYCSGLLDAAAGGSMLISDVEEMPPVVQEARIDLLAGLEFARSPSAAVRLVSGTTVPLIDRFAAGTFPEQPSHRVTVIHLMAGDGPPESRLYKDPMKMHLNDASTPARAL